MLKINLLTISYQKQTDFAIFMFGYVKQKQNEIIAHFYARKVHKIFEIELKIKIKVQTILNTSYKELRKAALTERLDLGQLLSNSNTID